MKRNMEEGQLSLLRSIYRNTSQTKTTNYNGSTLNVTYQDSSSRTHRLKSIATGKEANGQVVSYKSYDPNNVAHTLRRLRHAGSVAPKKKGF
jgi:endonuclease YncB( thermonuclease family)